MGKELKFKKPEYKGLEDVPLMKKHIGIFDRDPFAMEPTKKTFMMIAALRKRAYKRDLYRDPEVFYGMAVNFLACTSQWGTDSEGDEVNNGIPLNINAFALFCGVTYKRLWDISNYSEDHKEILDMVRDMIEMELEDKLTDKKEYHAGIATRLKCRYSDVWDRNTILAESMGEDTKFNFTIE